MRIAPEVSITEAQRAQLKAWAAARSVPVRVAERAKMTGLPETLPVPVVTLALPLTRLLLVVKTSV